MKLNLEYQFSTNRAERAAKYAVLRGNDDAWATYYAESEKWRQGALKFKNGVERRLSECKRLLAEQDRNNNIAYIARERDVAIREATYYRGAIQEHRDADVEDENAAEEVDERLWSSLDTARDIGI